MTTPTPTEIAQHYSACLDSKNLINELKAKEPPLGSEDYDALVRNQEHLRIMLAKDFWTTEDLTVLQDAARELP